jgi:hypothetical protein
MRRVSLVTEWVVSAWLRRASCPMANHATRMVIRPPISASRSRRICPVIGLIYMHACYHDSAFMRFIQPGTVVFLAGPPPGAEPSPSPAPTHR